MKTHVRWIFPILLAGLLLLSACQLALPASETTPPQENRQSKPEVPALDLAPPDDFATATFSMG